MSDRSLKVVRKEDVYKRQEYMRKNDYSADLIKKTIAEVTGTRYAIGPYKRKRQEEEARQSAEDVLSQLERCV